MAIYHFTAKVVGMGGGESAVHRAAYHARTQLVDERGGKVTKDYSAKGDLAWSGMFTPRDAPDWTRDRAQLWNKAEAAERQANGQPARNIEFAVPNELTREQQTRLITDFVREQYARKGMVADANLHSDYDAQGNLRPGADPNEPRNDHVHLLVTMRRLDGDSFKKTKTDAREWNSREQLAAWREQWAKHGARALQKAGFHQEAERFAVGHLTLPQQRQAAIDRGDLAHAEALDREPDMKQGAVILQMEKRGQKTERGEERRALWNRNAERGRLTAEFKLVNLQLERIRRQEQGDSRSQTRRDDSAAQRAAAGIHRAQEREKARFESWANARRAETQNARLEAEGDQGRAHERERLALENTLATTYGGTKTAYAASLAAIEKRQQERRQRTGRFDILARLTGAARKDATNATAYRATLADIARREGEQRQALNARQQADTARLTGQNAHTAARLERGIERARARREAEGWQPPPRQREATTGQEIGRSGDFNREADFSPVEGRENSAGETTTPGNEQAQTTPPEQAQGPNSGAGQEAGQTPQTGWSSEAERDEAIRQARERREADEREQEQDLERDDPGREID